MSGRGYFSFGPESSINEDSTLDSGTQDLFGPTQPDSTTDAENHEAPRTSTPINVSIAPILISNTNETEASDANTTGTEERKPSTDLLESDEESEEDVRVVTKRRRGGRPNPVVMDSSSEEDHGHVDTPRTKILPKDGNNNVTISTGPESDEDGIAQTQYSKVIQLSETRKQNQLRADSNVHDTTELESDAEDKEVPVRNSNNVMQRSQLARKLPVPSPKIPASLPRPASRKARRPSLKIVAVAAKSANTGAFLGSSPYNGRRISVTRSEGYATRSRTGSLPKTVEESSHTLGSTANSRSKLASGSKSGPKIMAAPATSSGSKTGSSSIPKAKSTAGSKSAAKTNAQAKPTVPVPIPDARGRNRAGSAIALPKRVQELRQPAVFLPSISSEEQSDSDETGSSSEPKAKSAASSKSVAKTNARAKQTVPVVIPDARRRTRTGSAVALPKRIQELRPAALFPHSASSEEGSDGDETASSAPSANSESESESDNDEANYMGPESFTRTIVTRSRSKKLKRKYVTYKQYIYRVFRLVYPADRVPALTISKAMMGMMDDVMNDLFDRLLKEAVMLVKKRKLKTLGDREIRAAVQLLLPTDLAEQALTEGDRALKNFKVSEEERKEQRQMNSGKPKRVY